MFPRFPRNFSKIFSKNHIFTYVVIFYRFLKIFSNVYIFLKFSSPAGLFKVDWENNKEEIWIKIYKGYWKNFSEHFGKTEKNLNTVSRKQIINFRVILCQFWKNWGWFLGKVKWFFEKFEYSENFLKIMGK